MHRSLHYIGHPPFACGRCRSKGRFGGERVSPVPVLYDTSAPYNLSRPRFPTHPHCPTVHCGKCPRPKPSRWLRRLGSPGSKPRQSPMPTSPPYSTYVSRRSKRRCIRSAPPTQAAQQQMVPQTRRRWQIRAISASLCERKRSVTIQRCTIPCDSTRRPFVPPPLIVQIPPTPLCSPQTCNSQLPPVRPVCTAPCARLLAPSLTARIFADVITLCPPPAGFTLALGSWPHPTFGICIHAYIEREPRPLGVPPSGSRLLSVSPGRDHGYLFPLLPLVYMLYANGPVPRVLSLEILYLWPMFGRVWRMLRHRDRHSQRHLHSLRRPSHPHKRC